MARALLRRGGMHVGSSLRALCDRLTRDEFLERFPHPWLLRELTADEAHVTVEMLRVRKDTLPGRTSQLPPTPRPFMRLLWRMRSGSGSVGAIAVVRRADSVAQDAVLVGRAASCDISLPDPSVSKLHAALLRREGEGWFVQDLHSTNGVRVNGRVSQPGQVVAIRGGSIVDFGRQHCELVDGEDLYDTLSSSTMGSTVGSVGG